jgi:hypothetical protein
MNQKIKQLAEQAGYTPLPGFDFANDIQELFIKKFAELIVEEMYCFMVDATSNDEPWPSFEQIKEHFGVPK